MTNQAEKEAEIWKHQSEDSCLEENVNIITKCILLYFLCSDSFWFYTTINTPGGVKDHWQIFALPHFHLKSKYSLIKVSEKSWDDAKSDEFRDQEWGEIPVSQATLNRFYSHCSSSGFPAGKFYWTERLSFPPRTYKSESCLWQRITGHSLLTLCLGKLRGGGQRDDIGCPGAPLLHSGIKLVGACSWSAQLHSACLSDSLTSRSQNLN